MQNDIEWFQHFRESPDFSFLKKRPIAYFCAEFAINDKLAIFAGGLGVLAGEFLREAADQELPLVAVGLYYHEGYVRQKVDENGQLLEFVKSTMPEDAKLSPVLDGQNKRVRVQVPIGENLVTAQAWKMQLGNVILYLLDTKLPENSPDDQK